MRSIGFNKPALISAMMRSVSAACFVLPFCLAKTGFHSATFGRAGAPTGLAWRLMKLSRSTRCDFMTLCTLHPKDEAYSVSKAAEHEMRPAAAASDLFAGQHKFVHHSTNRAFRDAHDL